MKNLVILLTLMSLSIFATETKIEGIKKTVTEKTNIVTKTKKDVKKKKEKKKEEKKEDTSATLSNPKKEVTTKEDVKKEDIKKEDIKKEDIKKEDIKKEDIKKEDIKNVNVEKPKIKFFNNKKPIKKVINQKKIKKVEKVTLKEKKIEKDIKKRLPIIKINQRENHKLGVSLNLGASSLLGLSLDYFITPSLNLELFAGFTSGISLKYHFAGNTTKKSTFYMGVSYGVAYSTLFTPTKEFFYLPVGIQFITKKGFTFSLDLGLSIFKKTGYFIEEEENEYRTDYKLLPMAGLKVGFHF